MTKVCCFDLLGLAAGMQPGLGQVRCLVYSQVMAMGAPLNLLLVAVHLYYRQIVTTEVL